jgi:hypothetical protein
MSSRPHGSQSLIFTKYVGTIKTKPQTKQHLSLGSFDHHNPAKGFSITFGKGLANDQDVVTEIATTGTPQKYAYTLYVTNRGFKTVSAEVWQM